MYTQIQFSPTSWIFLSSRTESQW